MIPPYSKVYDSAELQELVQWFEQRRGQLPQSLSFNEGFKIPDLPTMVERYLELLPTVKENPTFGAQLHHLFRIRGMLQEQGF